MCRTRSIRPGANAIGEPLPRNPGPHRHRLEHSADFADGAEEIARLKELGIGVVTTPQFIYSQGDTIGAFQVESRAQQQMAPRLKPACFADIAVEIAIVRPGPIQGGAVHPYLRRRAGLEPGSHLHPCLEPVLHKTLGVLLFQEQAIRVAMVAAGFSPGEADLLRRALSRKNPAEALRALQDRFVGGALRQGLDEPTARAIFERLAGFAGYGFCESHAASFALIAYQTLYLKHYAPAAFYCALLNQQPMGFYAPEVVVGDARRHGVAVLPPDVNRRYWRYPLAPDQQHGWGIRTGLSTVAGLGEQGWQRIETARAPAPFQHLPDFCRRTALPQAVVSNLIRAGACDGWGERRQLLWRLGELDYRAHKLEMELPAIQVDLPALDALERTVWEYELLGFSAAGQVMAQYREQLRRAGVLSTWQVKESEAGQRVRVAGLVVVRQRPGTAKGVLFMSLEDESGLLDLVVKPTTYERLRPVVRHQPMICVEGGVQRSGGAVSVLVLGARAL